jgi:hypothetical protein
VTKFYEVLDLINFDCDNTLHERRRTWIQNSYLHLGRKKRLKCFLCNFTDCIKHINLFSLYFIKHAADYEKYFEQNSLSVLYMFPNNFLTKGEIFIKLSITIVFTFMTFNSPPTDNIKMTAVWISEMFYTVKKKSCAQLSITTWIHMGEWRCSSIHS